MEICIIETFEIIFLGTWLKLFFQLSYKGDRHKAIGLE